MSDPTRNESRLRELGDLIDAVEKAYRLEQQASRLQDEAWHRLEDFRSRAEEARARRSAAVNALDRALRGEPISAAQEAALAEKVR